MLIPAICQNEKCKTVFFTPNMVGGDATVTMVDCSVGPCPKCGSMGNIPSGEYSPAGSNIFDFNQWKTLASALTGIRDDILSGASVQDVRNSIENNATVAAYLSKFAPQNLKDLQTLLIIIGMIFAAYTYLTSKDEPDPKVLLPKPALELIDSGKPERTGSPIPPPHADTQPPKSDAVTESSRQSKDNPQ